jgi:hypothetical protein
MLDEAITLYHEGIHYGDIEKLTRVFHPDAQLFGVVHGEPYQKTLNEYLTVVRERVSPAIKGYPKRLSILASEVIGHVAVVKLRVAVFDTEYVDVLTLVRSGDAYRIVNKTFTDA